jgi:hypothetical protein
MSEQEIRRRGDRTHPAATRTAWRPTEWHSADTTPSAGRLCSKRCDRNDDQR